MHTIDRPEYGNVPYGNFPSEKSDISSDPENNEALLETLLDYCTTNPDPDYALMLNGPWGSGKSFFVDRFIKDKLVHHLPRDNSRHPLVVSLYGVASAEDFSEALYVALHPVLSSSGARLLGTVAKGLLKTTVRIDLTENNSRKSNASLGIPDLDKLKLTGKHKEKGWIIFFDDFERSQMSGTDLLGLINPLVSNAENRVVIISNEDEIDKKDGSQEKYRRAKEKTVSFTLKIKAELDQAYTSFTKEIPNKEYKLFLEFSKPAVKDVMESAPQMNLRVLRTAIQSFRRVFLSIKADFRTTQHFEPLRDMFLLVLIAFIQTQTQDDDISIFQRLGMPMWRKRPIWEHKNKIPPTDLVAQQETRRANLRETYPTFNFHISCLSYDSLEALICRSSVNPELINKSLLLDTRFRSADAMPSWLALWNSSFCSDAVLERSLGRFRKDFDERTFDDFGEMLHSFGIYLKLCRLREEKFNDENPVMSVKNYIDDIYKSKIISKEEIDFPDKRGMWAPYSLGFTENDTESFKEIKSYCEKKHTEFLEKNLKSEIESFLSMGKLDTDSFFKSTTTTADHRGRFADLPILKNILPHNFVRSVFDLPFLKQSSVFSALNIRYDGGKLIRSSLNEEKLWIKSVLEEFEKEADNLRPLRREATKAKIHNLQLIILPQLSEPKDE
ncbi:P-loop NTPase fold protein [Gluconobacter oxydans]|uniref:P-loop NTPase fold protein n=1 Tax=Gluconobacter oxydans TaxID=442 RepID=UPI0039E967C7